MRMRLAVLVSICVLAATSVFAQTAVTATSGFSFKVSALDQTIDDAGRPVVGGYRVNFIPAQGCPVYGTAFLGKPTPDATGTVTINPFPAFATLPANCAYTLTVTAVGQGPASATSDPLGPFERFVTIISPSPPPPPLTGQGIPITKDDIDVAGCHMMRTPNLGEAGYTTFYPKAPYHRDDGSTWILQLTGDGHLVDYPNIAGVPCTTPLASVPQAPYGNDYGIPNGIHSSTDQIPGKTPNSMWMGIYVDETVRPRRVTLGAGGIYTTPFDENNQFTFEFDPIAGTLTLKKCWGIVGISATKTGGGGNHIPLYFRHVFLTDDVTESVGNGGPNGGGNGNFNFGMIGLAVTPPPDNACEVGVDHLISPVVTLVSHPPNNTLNPDQSPATPTCAGREIGCDLSDRLANSPFPQRIAAREDSTSVYVTDWDKSVYPVDGKTYSWIGAISGGASWTWPVWANGHEMVISTYAKTNGWINTRIAPSPPPTYINDGSFYGTGTVTLMDGYAHQGNPATSHPYPGFTLWLETGDPTAPGADTDNMRNFGCAMVDSYDVATRVMTFHWDSFCGPPMGANPYVPMVNGSVFMGAVYAHGMPGPSNIDNGLQLINPSQLAQVAQGLKDPTTVGYDEDFSLAPYMPQFGCTTCGTGGQIENGIGSPMADEPKNELLIPIGAPQFGVYAESHIIYSFPIKDPVKP